MPSIPKLTFNLSDACLDEAEVYHPEYTEMDLFNATLIFQHFLISALYKANIKLPHAKLEELAETTGKAIHELVISTTDIDLKKVI